MRESIISASELHAVQQVPLSMGKGTTNEVTMLHIMMGGQLLVKGKINLGQFPKNLSNIIRPQVGDILPLPLRDSIARYVNS